MGTGLGSRMKRSGAWNSKKKFFMQSLCHSNANDLLYSLHVEEKALYKITWSTVVKCKKWHIDLQLVLYLKITHNCHQNSLLPAKQDYKATEHYMTVASFQRRQFIRLPFIIHTDIPKLIQSKCLTNYSLVSTTGVTQEEYALI